MCAVVPHRVVGAYSPISPVFVSFFGFFRNSYCGVSSIARTHASRAQPRTRPRSAVRSGAAGGRRAPAPGIDAAVSLQTPGVLFFPDEPLPRSLLDHLAPPLYFSSHASLPLPTLSSLYTSPSPFIFLLPQSISLSSLPFSQISQSPTVCRLWRFATEHRREPWKGSLRQTSSRRPPGRSKRNRH